MPAKGEKAEKTVEEEKKRLDVKLEFTNLKLIKYAAIVALVLGIIVGITEAAGSGAPGPQRFAEFLSGLFGGIVYGGIIFALHEIVASRK